MGPVVSYIRVSTGKQGQSGLGWKPSGKRSPGSTRPRAWRSLGICRSGKREGQ